MGKKGFTLIELVMVIVIIGILAAIAIPRFANLRQDANKAACDGNVSAIRGALTAYYARTAVSPTFDSGNKSQQGFPKAITQNSFITNFFVDGALPTCPTSKSSSWYTGHYNSSTGNITAMHPLASH